MQKRILFFGDSNTYGFDPRGFWSGRYDKDVIWTNILSKNNIWNILAYGQNGRQIPSNEYEFEDLNIILNKESDLDCFAVMLGTNDILMMFGSNSMRITARMNEMIKFVKKHPNIENATKILLIAPVGMNLSGGEYEKAYNKTLNEIGEQYRELAKKENIEFVNAAEWEIDLAFDGVHFSELGHKQFADKMWKILDNILYR